jgi:hypothetical protein
MAATAGKAHLRKIRLELAREPGHPSGDSRTGYIIVAPLDADDKIDAESWKHARDACRVTRFRPGEDDSHGHLIRRPGGSWALHYDIDGDQDDEAGYHFGDERFMPGEYISIREGDDTHTYCVASVESV